MGTDTPHTTQLIILMMRISENIRHDHYTHISVLAKDWLAADYKLYNHFLQVFEREVLRWTNAFVSILQLREGGSCKRCGATAADEQAA